MSDLNTFFTPSVRLPGAHKYDSSKPAEAFDILSSGLSIVGCAGEMGISRKTIYEWRDTYPEFDEAVIKGVAAGQSKWERLAQIPKHEQYCPKAVNFALTNIYRVNPPQTTTTVIAPANDQVAELLNELAAKSKESKEAE